MPVVPMEHPNPDIIDWEVQRRSLQNEEFEVLESIYPEYISSQNMDGILKLEIPVEFESPVSITIAEDSPSSPTSMMPESPDKKSTSETLVLSALPPLMFHITLPPSYPLHGPPEIILLRATHMWLPQMQVLQTILLEMWQAGEPVLYNWVEYIRSGEFLRKMSLVTSNEDSTIEIPHPAPQLLAPLLSAYDASSKSTHFSLQSHPCSICLTQLKGSKCLQLSCKHIFCRSCLEDFWKLCIEEGDIGRVGCPDPECVKQKSEVGEEEVARVVTQAEVQRWRWLREKRDLDRDPTIVHCPVAVCQAPVSKPADVDTESGWSRLRQCPQCSFSFCAFCRRTWHGPIDKCPIAQYEYLALEYLGTEEGSIERARLERRFGRANIRRLVATYEEDKANMQWLSASTMSCPGCQCHVEKTMGCNHMTCWKCSQHFCYRCGSRLDPAQPYAHFSNPANTNCFNQLFDATQEDDDHDWEPMLRAFEEDDEGALYD
ncbi:hypothetical protein B0H34DRAFT_855092 [Crassisporium funariophilum]|nr:hypothetical protein B0H34DRAFT_855092 [Crassisporium funariophilum]